MIKKSALKLGVIFTDKATELEGMLTHWVMNMGEQINYILQPRALNDEGQPVPKLILEEARLKVAPDDFEEIEIPFEILGTQVTDKASGFTGMAVGFVRHINGCFHVIIQPPGQLQKTNNPINKREFDLRQCTGPMIVQLNEEQLAKSKKEAPSPSDDRPQEFIPGETEVDLK